MISPDRKLLFVHIPKTGGTSIAAALLEEEGIELKTYINLPKDIQKKYVCDTRMKHAPLKDYPKVVGNSVFNNYYKFAIIRNPYDRIQSQFNWNGTNIEVFERRIKHNITVQSPSQKSFVTDDGGNYIIDELFHFDELDLVFEKFGLSEFYRKKETMNTILKLKRW